MIVSVGFVGFIEFVELLGLLGSLSPLGRCVFEFIEFVESIWAQRSDIRGQKSESRRIKNDSRKDAKGAKFGDNRKTSSLCVLGVLARETIPFLISDLCSLTSGIRHLLFASEWGYPTSATLSRRSLNSLVK